MAKIQMGGIAAQVRGSIGNTTFSRNRGGAFIRARVSGVQPRTPKQTQVRANFAINSKAWSGSLTAEDRAAWVAFAATNTVTDVFGAVIQLNGVAMYQRLNQVLLQIGEPTISTPPDSYNVDPLPIPTGISPVGSDEIDLAIPTGPAPAGTSYYAFGAPPTAPGRTPTQSQYRFLGAFVGNSSGTAIDLGPAYNAAFGAWATGQNIAIEVGQVNTATGAVLPGVKFIEQAS